jgi:hypothetical protein
MTEIQYVYIDHILVHIQEGTILLDTSMLELELLLSFFVREEKVMPLESWICVIHGIKGKEYC